GIGAEAARLRRGELRTLRGKALQDFPPPEEQAGRRIGEDHLARSEALALGDAGLIEIDQAGFGAGDDETVVRDRVTQRAKAIAIKLGADELAVGKNESCGAIPRLAVLRERSERAANIAGKQRIVFVRRRNHGEHGFIGRKTLEKLELEAVVEAGGIADVVFERVKPLPYRELLANLTLFGADPAAIGNDGVDFAVL